MSFDPHGVMRFFSPASPCFFEGCETLRAQYFSRVAELDKTACPACHKGELVRWYAREVSQRMGVPSPVGPPSSTRIP